MLFPFQLVDKKDEGRRRRQQTPERASDTVTNPEDNKKRKITWLFGCVSG